MERKSDESSEGDENEILGDTEKNATDEMDCDVTDTREQHVDVSDNGEEKIRDEPRDDIKNFAEDTMNELLGWYGYEKASECSGVLPESKHLRRAAMAASKCDATGVLQHKHATLRREAHSPAFSAENTENKMAPEERMNSGAPQRTANSPACRESPHSSGHDHITECNDRGFVVCAWCEKGSTLDKHFTMTSHNSDVERKFCSELCYSQCRRESYKKQKICEWCKELCCSSKTVEFEDGGETLLFCSENCLNKYKMNIFCQETQEHMKKAQGEKVSPAQPAVTSASRILITPELWAEEHSNGSQSDWPKEPAKRSTEFKASAKPHRIIQHHEKPRHKSSMTVHHKNNMTNALDASSNSLLRVVALKAKAELEHPKASRGSCATRPPRMTDREKIKQIRMRDRLPLHTPLRETYRGGQPANCDTFSNIPSLKRDISHSPPPAPGASSYMGLGAGLSAGHALFSQSLPMASSLSQLSPLSASQLFGVIAASHGLRPTPSVSASPPPSTQQPLERSTERAGSDSCSSHSTSPRVSSSDFIPHAPTQSTDSATTPAPPPIYPPPNPFTHALPSYFSLPGGPLPFPTAVPNLASLSALGALYPPPPFMPTAMPNLVPPNTLMVPYPFPLPLPIPIPIPIPVPKSLVDMCKQENPPSDKENKNHVKQTKCTNNCTQRYSRSQERKQCSDCSEPRVKQERMGTRSVSPNRLHQRYFLDTTRKRCDSETDGAIDLSTTTTDSIIPRYRPRSRSPLRIASANNHTQPHPPLVIAPTSDTGSDVSPGSPYGGAVPSGSLLAAGCARARYSSRRSLILDAPSAAAENEHGRSPSPATAEKRSYNGPSVRDILYGKRKCSRPRIKTK